jgi:hypothetical protein
LINQPRFPPIIVIMVSDEVRMNDWSLLMLYSCITNTPASIDAVSSSDSMMHDGYMVAWLYIDRFGDKRCNVRCCFVQHYVVWSIKRVADLLCSFVVARYYHHRQSFLFCHEVVTIIATLNHATWGIYQAYDFRSLQLSLSLCHRFSVCGVIVQACQSARLSFRCSTVLSKSPGRFVSSFYQTNPATTALVSTRCAGHKRCRQGSIMLHQTLVSCMNHRSFRLRRLS